LVALQRWLLAVGAGVLVVGRHRGWPEALTAAGGTAVLAALALRGGILVWSRQRGITDRCVPPIYTSLLALAVALVGAGTAGAVAAAAATLARAKARPRPATAGAQLTATAMGGAILLACPGRLLQGGAPEAPGFAGFGGAAACTCSALARLGRRQRSWAGRR